MEKTTDLSGMSGGALAYLGDAVIELLRPIREETERILADKA